MKDLDDLEDLEDFFKRIEEEEKNKSKINKLIDFIRWKIFDRLETFYYDLKHFIRDIFIYAPVIWKNREYDYEHLVSFMIFKLKRMERLHRFEGHLERSIETADEIKTFITRLERLLNWEEFIDYDNLDTDAYIRLMQAQEQEYKDVFRDLGERIQSFWD